MTRLTILSATAVLSMMAATPVFAMPAIQGAGCIRVLPPQWKCPEHDGLCTIRQEQRLCGTRTDEAARHAVATIGKQARVAQPFASAQVRISSKKSGSF
jgi:hypothetical protein